MKPFTVFFFLALTSTIGSAVCFSQSDEDIAALLALCKEVPCHKAQSVFVNMDDGKTKEFPMAYPKPIVQGSWVSLFPGTSLYLTGEFRDDVLVNVRAITEPDEKRNVLHVRMFQESGHPDTYLVVTNYFSELVKYRAGMMLPDGDALYSTSSCPVMNDGRSAYEHWAHPIFQLVLADFQAISLGTGELVCD